MRGRVLVAIVLTVAGGLARVPVAAILGLVLLALEVVHEIWSRRVFRGLTYSRRLGRNRLAWGEATELDLEVWNRQWLPLAWFSAVDVASPGLVVRERATVENPDLGATLRNTWTLAPYERVVRHLTVTGERRGVHSIGPGVVTASDLFARTAAVRDVPAVERFLVRPRTLPLPAGPRPDRWGEADRALHGLSEDLSRFAGIRPYAPGDPIRRIHHRASARLGTPMTKRFEPSRERDVLIALDLHGPPLTGGIEADDERAESLIVVVASIARALEADGASFGFAAAGFSGRPTRFSEIPMASTAGHADRVLDLLARLSPTPSDSFEVLLARLRRKVSGRTTLLAVTGRDPRPFLPALRTLARVGVSVVVVGTGRDAHLVAATARGAGLPGRVATLDGPWRQAGAILVA